MSAFKNILLPTDFSPPSQHAAEYAIAFAKRSSGTVHVLHVVDTAHASYAAMYGQGVMVAPDLVAIENDLKANAQRVVAHAKSHGVDAEAHLIQGNPAAEATKFADKHGCDLIVMGSHGRSGFEHLIFGSTYKGILRTAHVPVLGIKAEEHEFTGADLDIRIERVVCPLDFSDTARAAVPIAAGLCGQFDAALHLIHVVDSRLDMIGYPTMTALKAPDVRAQAEVLLKETAALYPGVRVETHIMHGMPHREIARFVEDYGASVLVMATHGFGGVSRALLGSTTEKSVRLAKCPVLTVRP